MESERIIRFLREELTESEKLEVLDWIEKSDENKSIFSELKNTIALKRDRYERAIRAGNWNF